MQTHFLCPASISLSRRSTLPIPKMSFRSTKHQLAGATDEHPLQYCQWTTLKSPTGRRQLRVNWVQGISKRSPLIVKLKRSELDSVACENIFDDMDDTVQSIGGTSCLTWTSTLVLGPNICNTDFRWELGVSMNLTYLVERTPQDDAARDRRQLGRSLRVQWVLLNSKTS